MNRTCILQQNLTHPIVDNQRTFYAIKLKTLIGRQAVEFCIPDELTQSVSVEGYTMPVLIDDFIDEPTQDLFALETVPDDLAAELKGDDLKQVVKQDLT